MSQDDQPRIVVVEDDPASADVLQRRLEANGMAVWVGRDGAEGLARIRDIRPDLVLLDVMLPDTNGYDVCLQIKSDHATADIPVIFLSARGDVYDKVRGLSSGAVDYLTKPFHPAELLARVDAVLRRTEARAPRLVTSAGDRGERRPQALVVVADPARRKRIETQLASAFDVSSEPGPGVEVVLLEEGAAPPRLDGAAVLHIARTDVAAPTVDAELLHLAQLAARQRAMTADLQAATDALVVLAAALEVHDRSSPAHGTATARRAVSLARGLGLDARAQQTVRLGALLRDIGYAKLPAEIVAHPGEMSDDERAAMERHPVLGEELLRGFSPLAEVLPVVRMHHEHLDGSGYPDRRRGDQIPLEVRVVTVADRYEALLVDRPDRAALAPLQAVRLLQEQVVRGQLDAAVVAALSAIARQEQEGTR